MFHALALVKIKDGGTEHFFETLFQVTLVNCHLPAKFPDGQGFADMLQEYFPCPDDFFPVCLVCQKLTLECVHIALSQHTFQAVKQQDLGLGIDVNVFHAPAVGMVKQGFQDQPGPAA